MARIKISNATVGRVISQRGFVAVESYSTKSGETRNTKYTVWVDNPANIPPAGAIVTVEGNLSVKLEKFTNNEGNEIQYASTHVNQPQVVLVEEPGSQVEQAPEISQAPSNWTTALASEAPF